MAVTSVLDLKGKPLRDLTLSDEIFARADKAAENGSGNESVDTMHAALVRQLNNTRVGSANTKTRAEVRGGGAKPWRQKGTGRARAGSRRSPLWAGGGVTFGPKPRDYSIAMPAKKRHSAIKSALALRAGNLVVVDSFAAHKEVKTKDAAQVLQALKLADKKVLLVLESKNDDAKRFGLSARNLKNVVVVYASNLGVKEILTCQAILTSQAAMDAITNWLAPEKSAKKPKKAESVKAKVPQESKQIESKKPVKTESSSSSVLKNIATSSTKTSEKAQVKEPAGEKLASEKGNSSKKAQTNPVEKPKKDGSSGAKDKGKGK